MLNQGAFWRGPWPRVVVTVALLSWILSKVDLAQMGHQVLNAQWSMFFWAWLGLQGVVLLQSQRWKELVELNPTLPKLGILSYYYHNLQGHFYNQILPTSIGGDAVKTIALGRRIGSVASSVAAAFVNRWMGLAWVLLFFWGSCVFQWHWVQSLHLIWPVALASLGLAVLGALVWWPKWPMPTRLQPLRAKALEALTHLRADPKVLLRSFVMSGIMQLLILTVEYLVYRSAGLSVTYAQILLVLPVVYLVTMLPLSISGYGVREAVLLSLLTTIPGLSAEGVLTGAALSYALAFAQAGLAGCCLLYGTSRRGGSDGHI